MDNQASPWRVIALSSLGGLLEFYDFIIYAIYAVTIGQTFFPSNNPDTSILSAFLAFGAGYFARPIGGLIFGHLGDRLGRKKVFITSIIIMALAIFLMGILPGYSKWGVISSCLFVCLRLVQGMAIGGEIPGALTFVMEHVSDRPGLCCGMIFLCINLGVFLADGVHTVLSHFWPDSFSWRIAFILGGFMAFLSYIMRQKLAETPLFMAHRKSVHYFPLQVLLKSHYKNLIVGIFMVALQAVMVGMCYLYVFTLFKLTHHYTGARVSEVTLINLAVFSMSCAGWGYLSDKIGQRVILWWAALLVIPSSAWFYHNLFTDGSSLMFSYLVLSVICGAIAGVVSVFLASFFETRIRFSGIAFCYNIGFAIFGGLGPYVATYLRMHWHLMYAPWIILTVLAILTLILLTLRQNVVKI